MDKPPLQIPGVPLYLINLKLLPLQVEACLVNLKINHKEELAVYLEIHLQPKILVKSTRVLQVYLVEEHNLNSLLNQQVAFSVQLLQTLKPVELVSSILQLKHLLRPSKTSILLQLQVFKLTLPSQTSTISQMIHTL